VHFDKVHPGYGAVVRMGVAGMQAGKKKAEE
jgi:hypothetical protein